MVFHIIGVDSDTVVESEREKKKEREKERERERDIPSKKHDNKMR